MRYLELARLWAIIVGVVLLAVGVLGFVAPDALVGRQDSVLPTDRMHDAVHIVTGLIALGIGLLLTGENRANALIAFGVLYAVIFVSMVASPDMFGLMSVTANAAIHLVHFVVAAGSLAIGFLARNELASPAVSFGDGTRRRF